MVNYRRIQAPGATYFFTVVTKNRQPIFSNKNNIGILRRAFKKVKTKHKFHIDAIVVLPDHLHCMLTTIENYCLIWQLIKFHSAREIISKNNLSLKSIWQARYWEHVIRDDVDFENHFNYIHYNPVKHGYVKNVDEYPYSTFHRYCQRDGYELKDVRDDDFVTGAGYE